MAGTLYTVFFDQPTMSLDVKSTDKARTLAKALLDGCEEKIRHFKWIDDSVHESEADAGEAVEFWHPEDFS